VAGCCECGDEPSGSCATELVLLCDKVVSAMFLVELIFAFFSVDSLNNSTQIEHFHIFQTRFIIQKLII
jgi:hypothetical protein